MRDKFRILGLNRRHADQSIACTERSLSLPSIAFFAFTFQIHGEFCIQGGGSWWLTMSIRGDFSIAGDSYHG